MIIGKISDLEKDISLFNLKHLKKIIEIISSSSAKNLPDGKYEVEGKDLFYLISSYETEEKDKKLAEVHKKYIDLQYIQYGEELVGFAPLSSSKKIFEQYSEENDIEKYDRVDDESFFLLNPNMYAVFLPSDIHRPGVICKNKRMVRKYIFKIAI